MINIPYKPCCSKCKTVGLDNLDMIISIRTKQPLEYYKNLPDKLDINYGKSMVTWEEKNNLIICKNCGFTSNDYKKFEE